MAGATEKSVLVCMLNLAVGEDRLAIKSLSTCQLFKSYTYMYSCSLRAGLTVHSATWGYALLYGAHNNYTPGTRITLCMHAVEMMTILWMLCFVFV